MRADSSPTLMPPRRRVGASTPTCSATTSTGESMRNITVSDADADELRALLDSEGLTDVTVTGPDGDGNLTIGLPDDVDGISVDLLLQRYARARMDSRVIAASTFAAAFAAIDLDSVTTVDDLKAALSPVVTTAA